jgi:hypothetical protein
MDYQPDILDSSTFNRTANIQSTTQNEIDSFGFETIPTQLINVENSQASWASYLISPVKSNIRMAYDVVNYVVQSPKKGMIVGMILASHFITATAQYDCRCVYDCGLAPVNPYLQTMINIPRVLCDMGVCQMKCSGYHLSYLDVQCPVYDAICVPL